MLPECANFSTEKDQDLSKHVQQLAVSLAQFDNLLQRMPPGRPAMITHFSSVLANAVLEAAAKEGLVSDDRSCFILPSGREVRRVLGRLVYESSPGGHLSRLTVYTLRNLPTHCAGSYRAFQVPTPACNIPRKRCCSRRIGQNRV
jgi:hypothetical protein